MRLTLIRIPNLICACAGRLENPEERHEQQHSRPRHGLGPDGPPGPGAGGILRRPTAVWATAGASVVAFTGIGLVDPILPSIARGLRATPSQVSLLFTSYFLISAFAVPVTGFVSSRIGGRRTLLLGLAFVVVFAGLAGTSDPVGRLVAFRAGWGLGNALFVSTTLAVIVGAAAGGSAVAIPLYESARPRHGLRAAAGRAARRRQPALPVLRDRVPDGRRLPVHHGLPAAAPYLAPKIAEWGDIRVPFVVAAAPAAVGALVILVRRTALTLPHALGSAPAPAGVPVSPGRQ